MENAHLKECEEVFDRVVNGSTIPSNGCNLDGIYTFEIPDTPRIEESDAVLAALRSFLAKNIATENHR